MTPAREPTPQRESEPTNILLQPNQEIEIDTTTPLDVDLGRLTDEAEQYGKVVAIISAGKDKQFAVIDRRHLSPEKRTTGIDFLLISADEDTEEKSGVAILEQGKTFYVGRHPDYTECEQRFDLPLNVSREHFSIRYTEDGKVAIHNFEPTNGTTVYGRLARRPIKLKPVGTLLPPKQPETRNEQEPVQLVSAGQYSEPATKHPDRNEDAVLIDSQNGRYAVFDGMGGHASGDIASATAQEVLRTSAVPTDIDTVTYANQVNDIMQLIHKEVRRVAELWRNNMGTTALVAFEHTLADGSTELVVANVGDSRAYVLRDGHLRHLTLDDGPLKRFALEHNLDVMQLQERLSNAVRVSDLTDDEYGVHYRRNGITQAVGLHNGITPSIVTTLLRKGDKVLLCTDGVHDNLTSREIQALLQEDIDATRVAYAIGKAARRVSMQDSFRSKDDDISAVVLEY